MPSLNKNEFDIHKFIQQWFASKATLKEFLDSFGASSTFSVDIFTEKLIIMNLGKRK